MMNSCKKNGILVSLARFFRDRRGISAVEFAIIFPLMALIYLGGTATTQGIVIKRKVTITTRTVGDLVSQYTSITNAQKDAVFQAAVAVMSPYPTPIGTMTIVVSSVNITAAGVATIGWSDGYNTTGRAPGSSVTLPTGLSVAGKATSVIWAEAVYSYRPPVGAAFFSAIPLTEQFFLTPRRVTTITRS